VACGFTPIFGINNYNIFSLVVKLASFQTILALAVWFDWEIKSFDFNSTYLNGEPEEDEEIYMQVLPGYENQGEHSIKRLKKLLYGLKQARWKWYDALLCVLADLGFHTSQVDPGLFYTWYKGHILTLVVHVNNCIFTGSSPCLLNEYKVQFHAHYVLTDLGPVSWLLGIKVTQDHLTWSISLSQSSYINSILAWFALANMKAQSTPMVPGAVFSCSNSPSSPNNIIPIKKVPYREAIGSLIYTSIATRPNISFAVSMLSQFLDNPDDAHWIGVKRIFCYLAGRWDVELTYGATGFLDLLPPSSLCLHLLIALPLPLPHPLSGQRWLPLLPLLPANLLSPLLCLRPVMDRMVLRNFHCSIYLISSMPIGSSIGTISLRMSSLLRKARQDSLFGLTFSPLSTPT
jgi:Reverse transcriptase (RNA-dependent DNA polymerase)